MTTFEIPNGTLQIMSNNIIFFVGECYKAHPLLVSLFSLTEPWRRQNKHSYVHVGGEEGQARRG